MKFLWTSALSFGVALGPTVGFAQEMPPDESVGPSQEQPTTEEGTQQEQQSMQEKQKQLEAEQQRLHEEQQRLHEEQQRLHEEQQRLQEQQKEEPPKAEQAEPEGYIRPEQQQEVVVEEKQEKRKVVGPGFSLTAGGGVMAMSDSRARAFLSTGGAYTARLGIGTRSLVGLEAAYVGSAQNITAFGLDSSAALVSNGLEGDLRINVGTQAFQPYVLAGVGWKRYDLVNENFNTSSVRSQDDVIEIPFGAGLSWRSSGGFILDGRFNYRFTTNEDLIPGIGTGLGNGLDNWDATLKAGVEF